MKISAIIAEYNPFHNGHKYHIEETKKNCDAVVVLMSGSFVQRGEPAIFSKWQRAQCAVKNGADLVLELPTYYASSSSRDFAFGALSLLDSLNVIDFLSFGSESGDIELIKSASKALCDDDFELQEKIKAFQKEGLSYPLALHNALKECNKTIIENPNDLLGREYLKAIDDLSSSITPFCVKRTVAHDNFSSHKNHISAAAIRFMIESGEDVSSFIPEQKNEKPLFYKDIEKMLFYSLLTFDKKDYPVRSKSDCELLSRISSTPIESDIFSFLHNIKSKRYTMSRVKRTLLHILLKSGEKIPSFTPYIRVLALNDKGSSILKKIKKCSDTKIITKVSKSFVEENPSLALDILATDLRSIALAEKTGQDFTTSPFKL